VVGVLISLLVAIEIHAAGECPDAGEVERQLAPLLGDAVGVPASDVATIARGSDGRLAVTLVDAGGRPIGDRRFPRARSCRDEAQTVAVALAIWEAQIHPEISLRLDRLAPEAPPPALSEPTTLRVASVPVAPARVVSLGLAAAGDWQAGALAPAARLELGLGRGRWRARLAVLGVGRHALDLGPGQVTWWRGFATLGATVDVAAGRLAALVAGAGVATGVVSISGAGYAVDRTTRSLDAGVELGARVESRSGRVRPWLGVSVLGWARRQGLELVGADATSALPRVEPLASAGVEFVW
jgi:hypothetical protein